MKTFLFFAAFLFLLSSTQALEPENCVVPFVDPTIDADIDGVLDGECDVCPNTSDNALPVNVYDVVNADYWGCSCTQIRELVKAKHGSFQNYDLNPCVNFQCLRYNGGKNHFISINLLNSELKQRRTCPPNACQGEDFYIYPEEALITCQEGRVTNCEPQEIIYNDTRCKENLQTLENNTNDDLSWLFPETEDKLVYVPVMGYDIQTAKVRELSSADIALLKELEPYTDIDRIIEHHTTTMNSVSLVKNASFEENKSIVILTIAPGEDMILQNVTIYEIIPKEFAESTSELTFSQEPIIIKDDPLIMWHFDEVSDRVDLSYEVDRNVSVIGTTVVTAGEVMERKSYWNIVIPLAIVVLVIIFFLFKLSKKGDPK